MDPKVGQTIKIRDTIYGAFYIGILAKIVDIDLTFVSHLKQYPNHIRAEPIFTKYQEVILALDGETPRDSIFLGPNEYEIIE